jgi:hypothetical protein
MHLLQKAERSQSFPFPISMWVYNYNNNRDITMTYYSIKKQYDVTIGTVS